MDIKDLRGKKNELEEKLSKLIAPILFDFTHETEVSVKSVVINLHKIKEYGSKDVTFIVDARTDLDLY